MFFSAVRAVTACRNCGAGGRTVGAATHSSLRSLDLPRKPRPLGRVCRSAQDSAQFKLSLAAYAILCELAALSGRRPRACARVRPHAHGVDSKINKYYCHNVQSQTVRLLALLEYQRSRRNRNLSRATVLLSGGIDSTTCLAYYQEQGFRVDALFVDYGQASARRERRAAHAVCRYFEARLNTVRLTSVSRKGAGLIAGRNAFLLSVGLMEFEHKSGVIAIGAHSGTRYADCRPVFFRKMQSLFDLYAGGAVQIGVPFLRWRKADIWSFAQRRHIPLQLTYSCERGLRQPCGRCESCRDLEVLRASSHYEN